MGFIGGFLLFLIVFNFPIPVVYNSVILSVVLSSGIYICFPPIFTQFTELIRKKYILSIFLFLLICTIVSFIPPIAHDTHDFNIIKAFAIQFTGLSAAIYAYPLIQAGRRKASSEFNYFVKLLLIVFSVQSVVQVLAFVFPPVADFVHFFQKEAVTQMSMGGLRALAITGNPFFDLSAAYGFIYLYYFKYVIDSNKGKLDLATILMFALLFVGTFFAGRTGFVGMAIGLIYYFISPGYLRYKLGGIGKMLLAFTGLAFIIMAILPGEVMDVVENRLLPFAFEFIYNYAESGSVTTKSSENLSGMYFPISWQTFFLGDGRYVGKDGDYYMFTDAGYMRHILYYGIIGQILLLIYQLQFFRKPIKILVNNFNEDRRSAISNLLFFAMLLLYLLIIHYKGETLGFLPNLQVILMLTCISFSKSWGSRQLK